MHPLNDYPEKRGILIFNAFLKNMISENTIKENLQEYLDAKNLFIIDIHISPHNQIEITIDGDNYVSIEECAEISRYVESFLNRDIEDYSLIVSSPDANKPLIMPRQYPKHIGKNISILTTESKELKGKLISANSNAIQLLISTKIQEGKKKKKTEQSINIEYDKIKKAKIILPF